jgi:glycerophosphoryl diester phosphodiesterase
MWMRKPLVVGHRGAAGLEPEEHDAFHKRAVDIGTDAVEMDVRRSKDGELVITHDATVDRTTNGTGKVNSLKLTELKALDAGRGERIPTLEESLGSLGTRADLYIEVKEPETVPDTLNLVQKSGMLGRTTFVSFFHPPIRSIKERSPSSRCGVTFSCEPANPASLALEVKAEIVLPNTYVSDRMVKEAHSRSLLVQTWTVNNGDDLARVVRCGGDGVASDYPNLMIEAIG